MVKEGTNSDNIEVVDLAWDRLKNLTERMDRQFSLRQKAEKGRQYAVDHPLVTMFCLTTIAFCAIPLICFVGFVLTTVFFTFIGFLFVEGVLLTVGTLLLVGVLCGVGFLSLGVSTFLGLAWLSARAGHQLIGKIQAQKQKYQNANATPVENINGECLKDKGCEKAK